LLASGLSEGLRLEITHGRPRLRAGVSLSLLEALDDAGKLLVMLREVWAVAASMKAFAKSWRRES
jgi:hypothetical protein